MEKALNYFRLKGKPYWKLERDGKKIHEHEGDDVAEAEQELIEYLDTLEPGRYCLKVKQTKAGDAGQGHLDFVVMQNRETKKPMYAQPQPQQGPTLAEMLAAAKEEGKRQAEMDMRLTAIEKAIDDLREQLKKLTDDDDTNDAPALEKISNIASSLPTLMSGLKSLSAK